MSARRRLGRTMHLLLLVLRGALLFVLWNVVALSFVVMPPPYAIVWLLALGAAFVRLYAVPGLLSDRMLALGRARPIGPGRRWFAALVPVLAVLPIAMTIFLMALDLVPEEPLPDVLQRYAEQPGGAVVLLVMIVVMAPLLEEFAFRGWIQKPMEGRLGPALAIGITAVLFAVMHLQVAGLPIRIVAGAVLGAAVWATGSIWTGVALHAVWNAGVLVFGSLLVGVELTGRGWGFAAPAAAVTAGCLAVAAWAVARMRDDTLAAERQAAAEAERAAAAGVPEDDRAASA